LTITRLRAALRARTRTTATTSSQAELTEDSRVTIPRDREARSDPVLIGKYQRRLPVDDTRKIRRYLEEIYGAEVSPQAHQPQHRCGHGGGRRIAIPPAGTAVSNSDVHSRTAGAVEPMANTICGDVRLLDYQDSDRTSKPGASAVPVQLAKPDIYDRRNTQTLSSRADQRN
jgi:hypothetical protein